MIKRLLKNWGSGELHSPDPQFFIRLPSREGRSRGMGSRGFDFKKTPRCEAQGILKSKKIICNPDLSLILFKSYQNSINYPTK
jgi:hypothetical protein